MVEVQKNPAQVTAYNSQTRFNLWLAGRRGGKTFAMLQRLLKRVACSPRKSRCVYIGPTLSHAKDLVWDAAMEAMDKRKWRYKPRIAERHFELKDGRKLFILGAENIDRIRGKAYWHMTFDEIAYFSQQMQKIWKACRPALSDLKGGADFGTTPDGKGSDAYEFFMKYKGKPNWAYHHWRTIDNHYIDPQEIEDAKSDLDEIAFNQEYLATWETYAALAYYNYEESLHVAAGQKIMPGIPLHLVFDFNVNPTTLLLSQYRGRNMHYIKEYSFADSSTERTIRAFCQDYREMRSNLHLKIRGDAAGNQRKSTTGISDYKYIFDSLTEAGFKYDFEVRGVNPAIVDRVKIFNGWLRPMSGGPRVIVDPSCKELIKDLSGQKLEGRIPSPGKDGKTGHKADAAGYDIYWQWLVDSQTPSRSEDL